MTKNRGFPMWPFVLGVFQGHNGRATEAGGENDECVPCVPMRNPILRTRPPTNLLTILLVEFGNFKKKKTLLVNPVLIGLTTVEYNSSNATPSKLGCHEIYNPGPQKFHVSSLLIEGPASL